MRILDQELVYKFDHQGPNEHLIWMQDGAKAHTARRTITFLREHHMDPLGWPPNSCDMNPIENVWGIIMRELKDDEKTDYDTFEEAVIRHWNELP